MYVYQYAKRPWESDPPEGCSWERHAPVVTITEIGNLHHRLFVVPPERTLPDGRRDVIADPDADLDGLVYDGELDRSMTVEEIKKDAKLRLVPWQKRQSPTDPSLKRTLTGGDVCTGMPCGPKVLVIPSRAQFWAKKFIHHGKKTLEKPIALECSSDEEDTD